METLQLISMTKTREMWRIMPYASLKQRSANLVNSKGKNILPYTISMQIMACRGIEETLEQFFINKKAFIAA